MKTKPIKIMIIRLVATLAASLFLGFDSLAQVGSVLINEIRTDQPGTDNDEYFELIGPPGASLDGLTYLVIGDSPTGTIEAVVDLSGHTIPADGFFLVAEDTFNPALGTPDLVLTPNALNFENSDNVTHLLVGGFTGALGDDLDADNDCTQDVFPWTLEYDRIALVEEENPPTGTECHYGPPQIGPDGAFVPTHVYRCEGAGGGSYGWFIGLFDPIGARDTPGGANYNCTQQQTGDITAHKFNDLNGNGVQDAGEPDLEGWTMTLFGGSDCASTAVASGSTNASGTVIFSGVPPGAYSVSETLQAGWLNTTALCQNVALAPGGSEAVNFGNQQATGTIGDYVWRDTDGDGIQDPGEPGVEGVTATLFASSDCSAGDLATMATDANGHYAFTNLALMTYCIQFSDIPAGWSISPQNQGADDALDSDADPTTAQIQNVALANDDDTRDMGLSPPRSPIPTLGWMGLLLLPLLFAGAGALMFRRKRSVPV